MGAPPDAPPIGEEEPVDGRGAEATRVVVGGASVLFTVSE